MSECVCVCVCAVCMCVCMCVTPFMRLADKRLRLVSCVQDK